MNDEKQSEDMGYPTQLFQRSVQNVRITVTSTPLGKYMKDWTEEHKNRFIQAVFSNSQFKLIGF